MNAQLKATRPQDVKALKEMDPTPAPHHRFSLKFSKLASALVLAQLRFLRAAFKYVPEGQNASVRKRQRVGSRLDDITKVIRRCDAFVVGDASRSDQHELEKGILERFLVQRAVPFVEFWRESIEAIANGASLDIKWRDIPVWFSENFERPPG